VIPLAGMQGQKIAVLGLARSGLVAARALKAAGAEVRAWDDGEESRAAASREGIGTVDLTATGWEGVRTLILSPGIPHTHPKPHPAVERARANGVAIIGDIELLARAQSAARYVAVTGTNGKSTTTALIGHLLRGAGRRAELGGNLGMPALSLAPLGADGIYVLELSSYQLELTFSRILDVAVLLNVTPDHLERHGGMPGYVAAKRRIFALARPGATAVVGVDDDYCRGLARGCAADPDLRVVRISGEAKLAEGISAAAGELRFGDTSISLAAAPALPGKHNWQNAAAATAAVRVFGLDAEAIRSGLVTYPGLPHRQELVGERDGIRFINDSKATNADAAAKALACYDRIHWILGGLAKSDGIDALADYFPRIEHAYLIGAASDRFAATLEGKVRYSRCGDLESALAQAAKQAERGAIVLLSPACASFDQWANFEARGDAFRDMVQRLPRVARPALRAIAAAGPAS
jgi:UDP-N-acetylmuramoylalanine--D-glutamate ligase